MDARTLGWQGQIEGEPCCGQHVAVANVVAPKPV